MLTLCAAENLPVRTRGQPFVSVAPLRLWIQPAAGRAVRQRSLWRNIRARVDPRSSSLWLFKG